MIEDLTNHAAALPHLLDLRRRFANNRHLSVVVDDPKNLARYNVGRQIPIHRFQPALGIVIFRNRTGLVIERIQARANHFFPIVIADNEFRAVNVARFVDFRWLKVDVVDPSTGGTRTTSGEPA
jgi:gluconate kinase